MRSSVMGEKCNYMYHRSDERTGELQIISHQTRAYRAAALGRRSPEVGAEAEVSRPCEALASCYSLIHIHGEYNML